MTGKRGGTLVAALFDEVDEIIAAEAVVELLNASVEIAEEGIAIEALKSFEGLESEVSTGTATGCDDDDDLEV